jgi:AmiR/NasT family two-component response regulator
MQNRSFGFRMFPVNPEGKRLEDFLVKKALVVDDKAENRREVAEALVRYGFSDIIEAENGRQAVDLAVAHKPLLIVMDVGMPIMDGLTAAEIISKKAPAPIVLLTGKTDAQTVERARLAGVMNYVVKPFREEQFFPAVDLAIHHFVCESSLREEVDKLKETLEARKMIEKAKGLLMKNGLSEEEAYRRIQKLAMNNRKSLREVAEAILLTDGLGG